MSDTTKISGASDKVVILDLHRSSLTSGRADAANIPAPSIIAKLEKNNRILAAERDALLADAERYRWLKSRVEDYDGHACFPDVPYPAPIPDRSPFDAIDAAIDAARGSR